MITPSIIIALCWAYAFFALFAVSSTRFRLSLHSYVLASFFLAAIAASSGYARGSSHLILLALLSLIFKCGIIPFVISRTVAELNITPRLVSSVRPSAFRFLSVACVGVLLFALAQVPIFANVYGNVLIFDAGIASVIFAALSLMASRNVFSSIFGILALENGIALLAFESAGEFSFMIEIGLFLTGTIAVMLMSVLGRDIRLLFGTEDTGQLSELAE
jgi:hydrogenase-4 membrane subunit HyfE